jgi:hypothetical protein
MHTDCPYFVGIRNVLVCVSSVPSPGTHKSIETDPIPQNRTGRNRPIRAHIPAAERLAGRLHSWLVTALLGQVVAAVTRFAAVATVLHGSSTSPGAQVDIGGSGDQPHSARTYMERLCANDLAAGLCTHRRALALLVFGANKAKWARSLALRYGWCACSCEMD